MKTSKTVRLSSYIKPERYQLMIKPDLKGFTFEGFETIKLILEKSVLEITMNAKELTVDEVYFKSRNYHLKAKAVKFDVKAETVTFIFGQKLPKGGGELSLKFEGVLNDKMRGFYRSRYTHEGKEKHMATTQFEATDARRAFPCFDEPAHKAVFDLTLMVPKHLTAISNTLELEVLEHDSGYKLVKFQPTPKMSTYLLAFIVGDFEYIEGKTKSGVLVRVFVTPGKKHQAKFALGTAIKCLEFYNRYFAIPYPLPVLDLIAIPDFSHGAMENWGAVTYRESALLVDPEHSSAANKQWVALVIAHELAHQWFGNLVTMQWWTHLWLNEGFASYIEYLAVNELFPKWDIWTQFAYNDLNPALELDSLKTTHPIEVEVYHADEIGEIFDEISYSKGSSVIRMLAGYLGERDFRDGLRLYLKTHAYGNASTEDLWRAFEKVSKKPVQKMMENWTSKGGYPVVKIRTIKHNKKNLEIEVLQQRFFSSPLAAGGDDTLWQIPISVLSPGSKNPGQYFLARKRAAFLDPHTAWLKINAGETAFFRTSYDNYFLEKLGLPVKSKQLPPVDRLGLIRDLFALAEAGVVSAAEALEFTKNYRDETDYTVWMELASGLADLKNLIYGQKFYGQFERLARELFEGIGKSLGWRPKKDESHTQGLLRSLALNQLISYNDKRTIEAGQKLYKSSKGISADIRSVVYHAAAAVGDAKLHRELIEKYNTETLSEEKGRIGRALGQFSNKNLLDKTLKFALSGQVRIQDTAGVFASVWANQNGKHLAWKFTKQNWQTLLRRYPASGHILNRFVKLASGFVSSREAGDVAAFFKGHPAPGAERAVSQVLEKIHSNDAWLKRDGKNIENWLKLQS